MSGTYKKGIAQGRAGVWYRFSAEQQAVTESIDGRAGVVVQGSWGNVDEVSYLTNKSQVEEAFGTEGTAGVINKLFDGGISEVFAIRATGDDAEKATLTLNTKSGDMGANEGELVLELKCPGTRQIQLQLKANLGDPTLKTLTIFEDTTVLEEFPIVAGIEVDEVQSIIDMLANSQYVAVKQAPEHDDSSIVEAVATTEFTGGVDPTITVDSYADALVKLEKYRVNTLSLDTVDEDVIALAQEYVNRLFDNGKFVILVVATKADADFQQKILQARGLNDRNVVLIDGAGYTDSKGNVVDEEEIAAQYAAMVASTSSKYATTLMPVENAFALVSSYSTDEYRNANVSGLVTLSIDDFDRIVIERGITTLSKLDPEIEDAGWKKIKRLKTRNEMFYRLIKRLAQYISRTNNDDEGREFLRGQAILELDEMAQEKKIAPEFDVVQTDEIEGPDKVSFDIRAYDYDSLEEIYEHFVLREIR